MDHKERFIATIHYQPVDRPAAWLGLPVPSAEPGLMNYFGVSSIDQLRMAIDDDIYPVDVPYNYPPSNHIACAFKFAKVNHLDKPNERTLTAPGFFEDYSEPADVEKFERIKNAPAERIKMGILWSAHFQDVCSAFGMEHALTTMYLNPDMFRAVIDRITDFYLKANEIFYDSTKGFLDAVLIGNDFGSQTGLMVDPDSLREYVFPGTKKLIDQAKSYGLTVMHHSCGSIFPVIEDLADLGADIIHPVQALASEMDAPNLKKHFDGKVAFCGGVDAQNLLVNGKPEDVAKKVAGLKELFSTGLILSPSHEAVLPDIPPENIMAMFNAIK